MMQPPHFSFDKPREKASSHSRIRLVIGVLLALLFCFSAYKVIIGSISEEREQAAFKKLYDIVAENSTTPAPQSIHSAQETIGSTSDEVMSNDLPVETELTEPDLKTEPVPLPQYAPLVEMNHDFFGWLSIEGTEIDYPVMYTPDETEYYLRRAFDGSYSGSGVLFLDGNCAADGNYYLIYGHHMKNETMFGQLPRYANKDFWEDHPVIRLDTLYEQREYIVIAAFLSRIYDKNEQGVFRYYEYFDLSDEAIFGEYVQQVKAAALYDTGITAEYGDELLVLSTCNYHTANGRFVVVAKRVT